MMSDDPVVELRELAQSATNHLEEYLLSIFGSAENARKYAHLYVLEEKPATFFTDYDTVTNNYNIRMETEYRLREKTPEELASE
jgi:hypothetical protein